MLTATDVMSILMQHDVRVLCVKRCIVILMIETSGKIHSSHMAVSKSTTCVNKMHFDISDIGPIRDCFIGLMKQFI